MGFEDALDRLPEEPMSPRDKLLAALEMCEEGVAIQRLALQRQNPDLCVAGLGMLRRFMSPHEKATLVGSSADRSTACQSAIRLALSNLAGMLLVLGCSDGSSPATNATGTGGTGSTATISTGGSGTSGSGINGYFKEVRQGETNDCSSTPSVSPTATGAMSRFQQATSSSGENVLWQSPCDAIGDCEDVSYSHEQRGDGNWWRRSKYGSWTTSPPCKYTVNEYLVTATSSGLTQTTTALSGPVDAEGDSCPHEVSTALTCTFKWVTELEPAE